MGLPQFRQLGVLLLAIGLPSSANLCLAEQTATATQPAVDASAIKFSVVSVKENRSDTQKWSFSAPREGDSISYTNYPLFYVVIYSNDFHRADLVYGLPEWTKNARYDIVAKVAPEDVERYHALPAKQRLAMFQQVLADRFKLQFHREPKELPALEMTVAKGGSKLKTPNSDAPLHLKKKYGQSILLVAPGHVEAEGGTMSDLALFLTGVSHGEQYVDKTGLTGTYDFTIKYSPGMAPRSGTDDAPSASSEAPSLPTALREQLGIQLKSSKVVLDCFVVDHIERPTPD